MRFAEAGIDALAVDYSGGRPARATAARALSTCPMSGGRRSRALRNDMAAGAAYLGAAGERALFTVGFYGWPVGPTRNDTPAPADVAARDTAPVLAIFAAASGDAWRRVLDFVAANPPLTTGCGGPIYRTTI